MRGVASEITHECDPFFRADTLFEPHDYRYSATHEGRDANRHVQTGTKIMSPPIAWTNTTSVSKATRAGTRRQQNNASVPCAHTVVEEKRDDDSESIVARPDGHARRRYTHPQRRGEHRRRAHPSSCGCNRSLVRRLGVSRCLRSKSMPGWPSAGTAAVAAAWRCLGFSGTLSGGSSI